GMDADWRRRTVAAAAPPADGRALDVGTGTGSLALALAAGMPRGQVLGVDFAAPMLARVPARAAAAGLGSPVAVALGDGLPLLFAAATFACVTSAFVIRNVVDHQQAFAEQARVLRPGGRVVCLELTRAQRPIFRYLFRWYFHRWVPLLGGLIAGDAAAYTY